MKEKIIENLEQNYISLHDSKLLVEIAKKNKGAFEELFKRYAQKVKFLMLKMGARELDAEEISQEVMVILWRKASLYDSQKSSVSVWLYTIARNYRIDLVRKGNRFVIDTNDPTFVSDNPLTPLQLLIKNERKDRVKTVLKNLSDDKRQLLIAAFFEGLTHAELAKKFNKPLGTIKSRLRLIYDSLRKVNVISSLGDLDE